MSRGHIILVHNVSQLRDTSLGGQIFLYDTGPRCNSNEFGCEEGSM